MSEEQVRQDMDRLAGRLPHRGSSTEYERSAAEYVYEQFKTCTPTVDIDDFHAPTTFAHLFAAYYAEFTIVSLVATWWPWAGLAYGGLVFIAYLAEFAGYSVFGRFLPQYETQNVIARFEGLRPQKTIVVTAHLDTGKTTPVLHPAIAPRLWLVHWLIVLCMFIILVTCVMQGFGLFAASGIPFDITMRWTAVTLLLAVSATLLYGEGTGEHVRGAVTNASGVAVLLELARVLKERPCEDADIWLAATGAGEAWMRGMHRLLTTNEWDRDATHFINVAHVGGGELQYTIREGMLHAYPCSKELIRVTESLAEQFDAKPIVFRGKPTDSVVALARGYHAISILGVNADGTAPRWREMSDTLARVDYPQTMRAANFVEETIRKIQSETLKDK